jgi:two-component system chemotaxis response regulator CheB
MRLVRGAAGIQVQLDDDPPVQFCRPAVDPLFLSVAELYGRSALAVVLTGMGEDGLAGARAVRAAGGCVLAQDPESSVVWGMPGAVVKAGVAEALDIPALAREVALRAGARERRSSA